MSEAQAKALEAFDAYQKNIVAMNQIVREMKEIPELPSEVPQDVQALQKVEFPEKGGVLTYMEGHEHPYKGFPFFEFVEKIDTIKKIQRATLSSLYHSMTARPYWQLICLVFVPWLFADLLKAYINTFHRIIDRFKLKVIRHCDAVRELHRAFSIDWYDETLEERELRHKIRDILCMFLEYDNAYRFRFQDIIVELDKTALQKNPAHELARLFRLMADREITQEIKDTWSLVLFFFPWYLRFNTSLKKSIIAILTELDLSKVALSVEDQHFCAKRTDYQFGFQLCQQQNSTSTKDSHP